MPVHVVGDAASETLVVTENTVVSVEAEATHIPEFFEVSVEGAAGRHPDPGQGPRAARRARRCSTDEDAPHRQRHPADLRRGPRGRARGGRGRGRHRARGLRGRGGRRRARLPRASRRGRLRRATSATAAPTRLRSVRSLPEARPPIGCAASAEDGRRVARRRSRQPGSVVRRAPAQHRLPASPTSWPTGWDRPLPGPQVRPRRRRRGPAGSAGHARTARGAGPSRAAT